MSRILDKISARINEAISPSDWFKNKARLAIYYAQKGDAIDAAKEISQIRNALQSENSACGVIYANLVEATICFQRGSNYEAIEKSRRAYALSNALADKGLISLSAAWLAHFCFNAGQYENAISFASECLADTSACENIAFARSCLVIANLYHFFDDFQSAKEWYDAARIAAVDEGDEVMIGVILYNIATYRLNNIRMSELTEGVFDADTFRLNLEAASSSNFDSGVQSTSLPLLLPLLNAQVQTLNGRFSEAAELFEKWLYRDMSADMKRLYPALRADYAWCLANLGRKNEALHEISIVNAGLSVCDAPDDRAMALYRIAMAYSLFGSMNFAIDYLNRMRIALSDHRLIQIDFLKKLNLRFGQKPKKFS